MEINNNFPYVFRDVNPDELKEVNNIFKGTLSEFIRVGPKGYIAPKEFAKHAASIYNMLIRPNDIFVATYQRSGTTMTQELVWLLVKDFDYETAKSTLLTDRYPFLEVPMFMDDKGKEIYLKRFGDTESKKEYFNLFDDTPVQLLARSPDPRFVKTHMPMSLMSPKLLDIGKVVYVARDPRDVIVSVYHHTKLFIEMDFQGDFKQFWNLFRKDLITWTPYFEHVKEAWAVRHHPNMLFLFYEDLTKDLPATIRRIAKFLGKEPTEEQISGLCDHLNFNNFKNNKAVNFDHMRTAGLFHENEQFIRKGQSGGWRKYFDEEMIKQLELWIIENLRGTDLRFPSMQDLHTNLS